LIPAGTGFEYYRNVRIPADSLSRRSCLPRRRLGAKAGEAAKVEVATAAAAVTGGAGTGDGILRGAGRAFTRDEIE
jgi:hypothetical protein